MNSPVAHYPEVSRQSTGRVYGQVVPLVKAIVPVVPLPLPQMMPLITLRVGRDLNDLFRKYRRAKKEQRRCADIWKPISLSS